MVGDCHTGVHRKGREMFEDLGRKKFALPVLLVVLIGCVMALMFYPIVNMAPKELPFAVLNLDTGTQTPQGEVNAGETMAENLVGSSASGGNEVAPIAWNRITSQADLDNAIAENKYYGALAIPANFTQGQALAQAGQGDVSAVSIVLDNAKSPMIASQMSATIGEMFEQMGVDAEIEIIHTGASETSSGSPMASMMSQQIGVMPLLLMSLIGSILLTRLFPKKTAFTTRERFMLLAKQLGYALGYSLLAALATFWLLNGLVGVEAPFFTMTAFLWFASFCIIALFLGAFNLAPPLGIFVVVGAVLCGMMTGVLPREALPAFWADWIYPWVPQPFLAGGTRDILYMGADLMPRGSAGLLTIGGAGLVLLIASGFVPANRSQLSPTTQQ